MAVGGIKWIESCNCALGDWFIIHSYMKAKWVGIEV